MSSYTNPIILNLNLEGSILKGTFTYKFDSDKMKFILNPLTEIYWNKKKIMNCIYDKNNSNIEIICNDFIKYVKKYNHTKGFNLEKLKIK